MKRIALALMLLMLSSVVQATTHYEETTTLFCKWSGNVVESFTLDGPHKIGMYEKGDWIDNVIQRPKHNSSNKRL